MPETMGARWRVTNGADAVSLQVELWNGHRLVLNVPHDGEASVALHTNAGEADFATISAAAFRAWLESAQGRRR